MGSAFSAGDDDGKLLKYLLCSTCKTSHTPFVDKGSGQIGVYVGYANVASSEFSEARRRR